MWKWLAIIQGYDLDIQHIPGKVNPADHLSRQLLKDAAERKGLVTEENQKFVEQLRIPHDATDVEIQDALCKIFERERHNKTEREGQNLTQRSDVSPDQILSLDRQYQSSDSQKYQCQSSVSSGPDAESILGQKSGTRRAAIDSEQKNSGQRSTGHKSGQKSAIKSKKNFSSIFTEITEDD